MLDVVGAINILDKSVNKQFTKNRELPKIGDTKYRRVLLTPIVSHTMELKGQWRSAYDWAAVCGNTTYRNELEKV